MFQRLFGTSRQRLSAEDVRAQNQKAEQELLHRRALLVAEIEAQQVRAKAHLKQGDKQGASTALRRRRRAQQRLDYTESQLDVVQSQLSGLEDVTMHRQVTSASAATTRLLNPKNLVKEADEAAEALASMEEAMEAVDELGVASGATYTPPYDVTSDLAELEVEVLADALPSFTIGKANTPATTTVASSTPKPPENALKTDKQVLDFALS